MSFSGQSTPITILQFELFRCHTLCYRKQEGSKKLIHALAVLHSRCAFGLYTRFIYIRYSCQCQYQSLKQFVLKLVLVVGIMVKTPGIYLYCSIAIEIWINLKLWEYIEPYILISDGILNSFFIAFVLDWSKSVELRLQFKGCNFIISYFFDQK